MINQKNISSLKIVVVDDSDFSRSQIISILKSSGLNVVGEANSAEEAIKQIADKKPHLIITDIVMPNISGLDLAEKINSSHPEIGVILISSLTHEQVVLEAIAKGAIDFIAKPIVPLQLIESVEKFYQSIQKDI